MSLDSDPVSPDEQQQQQHDAPPYHPSPPPDELFEISTTVDPSYIISLIRKIVPHSRDSGRAGGSYTECVVGSADGASGRDDRPNSANGDLESMDIVAETGNSTREIEDSHESCRQSVEPGVAAGEVIWEGCGCILWDLAANKTHAELMVQNLVLEVLLANLRVSKSVRVMEICLGIIGNLACHEIPMKQIVSTNGLIETILDKLFLDDTQCLCEVCRLLTLGLQSNECVTWAKELQSEHMLARILWIAENTLNPQLIEKSIGLLLAILESQNEVTPVLLPLLMRLGFPNLLINLFTFEMSKLVNEKMPERYCALDITLRAIESLSVMDDYSQEISTNKELFLLVCELVKMPDKVEVASSCITAAVLIANILSDVPDLTYEISHDRPFLQGLFDIFPFTSDDLESRSALWSIIARLLARVRETEMSRTGLHHYVSVMVDKADVIEEDLLDNPLDDSGAGSECQNNVARLHLRVIALKRIIGILNHWMCVDDHKNNGREDHQAVTKLLECCKRYTE